jgi:hypothetical protein
MMEKWEVYAEGTFNNMRGNIHNWNRSFDDKRKISRDFYYGVFDAGNPNPLGLISELALENQLTKKYRLNTWDHYHSPQFVGRMIAENYEKYLEDYGAFKKIFLVCTQQICVTKKENENLSFLTAPDKEDYKVLVPTNLKYNHLGIKLYQREEGKVRWKHSYPVDTNILDIPEDLLEYEKRYLIT